MQKYYQGQSSRSCKFLLFACIFIVTIVEICSRPQTIDCRIHLYAPVCRGVAAKRALFRSYTDGLRLLTKRLSYDEDPQQYLEA